MERSQYNFQLVILECPYEIWDRPLVQSLFLKMVSLKRQGYGSNYSENVLPVDTSDFLATHVLLCITEADGSLKPIMGFKSASLQKCLEYNLAFPGVNLVRSAQMPEHIKAVEQIVDRCRDEKRGLTYCGSWTIDTEFKKKYYEVTQDLSDATTVFYFALHKEQKIKEVILGGTLRFHTEKIFETWGFKPISLNNKELDPIKVAHLAKEPVVVMHSTAERPLVSTITQKKWQKIWSERIHLKSEFAEDTSGDAAA